jgi:hypothetical protein
MGIGRNDRVFMSLGHHGLTETTLGFQHASPRVHDEPYDDGQALLEVLRHERIDGRFDHVVIGSGHRRFGQAAAVLAARGVRVTVVCRKGGLSPDLGRAAHDVIYFDTPQVTLDLPQAAPTAIAVRLLAVAARLLPAGDRSRYGEELWSELSEIARAGDGRHAQVTYAVRQLVSALRLRTELQAPRRRSATR